MNRSLHPPITARGHRVRIRAVLGERDFSRSLAVIIYRFNRGMSEADKWRDALEGNVNDRSLIDCSQRIQIRIRGR